jgi:hypothetical protein
VFVSDVRSPDIFNGPSIFVVYVGLPIFIVFTIGDTRSVPVPIFIPPVAVESDPIIIGPVVCCGLEELPPPIYKLLVDVLE